MQPIALSTGSLYTYGIARVFELAAEAGFGAIEVLADHRWDSRQPAYLQRLSHKTGLPIVAIHNPFSPHVPGWPREPLSRLRQSVALARELGAGVVVTHLPLRIRGARIELIGFQLGPLMLPIFLPNNREYHHFLLNGLSHFEAKEGIQIGVENMPAKQFFGRRVDIHALNRLETLSTLPHLTFDTTHLGTWGLDILDAYEQLKPRIVHVHLSNFDGEEHRHPEDGHLPLGELIRRLVRDGYEGAISIELHPEVLGAEDEAEVLRNLRRAVAFCHQHLNA